MATGRIERHCAGSQKLSLPSLEVLTIMVWSVKDPNENTRTRAPASGGKKWGQPIPPVGPPGDPSDSSGEISSLGVPPRPGTS